MYVCNYLSHINFVLFIYLLEKNVLYWTELLIFIVLLYRIANIFLNHLVGESIRWLKKLSATGLTKLKRKPFVSCNVFYTANHYIMDTASPLEFVPDDLHQEGFNLIRVWSMYTSCYLVLITLSR